jgi:hypothetical protein
MDAGEMSRGPQRVISTLGNVAGTVEAVAATDMLAHAAQVTKTVRSIEKDLVAGDLVPAGIGDLARQVTKESFLSPAHTRIKAVEKIGSAAGLLSAGVSAYNLFDATRRGDRVDQVVAATEIGVEAIGRFGGPVGAAFDGGFAVGGLIDQAIDLSPTAHAIHRDVVGGFFVWLFGINVDHGAQR